MIKMFYISASASKQLSFCDATTGFPREMTSEQPL